MAVANMVIIIGGGFSGMCAAIQMRKLGVEVHIAEIDPDWRAYGAGITIGGPTLRALGVVGVLPQVVAQGWCADGVDICAPNGAKLMELPTPRVAGPDVPGGGAIMRPVLAKILADATRASGTQVRLGVTFESIRPTDANVEVTFTDGRHDSYDLLIGADGWQSKTRDLLFPDGPKPKYTGQGVWRAVLPRHASISRPTVYMGHKVKAGLIPVSKDEMYMFVTEDRPDNDHLDPKDLPQILKGVLAQFGGLVAEIRDGLGADSRIVFRPLEALLLPLPWVKGRAVLIGDTVHATTPHLAAGAGIGIEDAIVLAEEIGRESTLADALEKHQARRWERCRMVVQNSVRLGEIEIEGGSKEEHSKLMGQSLMALAAPI